MAAGLAATPGYRYTDVLGDRLFVAGQVPLDGSGALLAVYEPHGASTVKPAVVVGQAAPASG